MSTVVCSTVQRLPNKIFNVKNSESESESSESNSDESSDEFPDDFENEKKENDDEEEEDDDDDDENEDKISKRYPCSFCEKEYSYKSWLKRHLTVDNKTFACDYCPEIFMEKYKLQMHT